MKGAATLKETVSGRFPKRLPVLDTQVIYTTLGANLTLNDLLEKKINHRETRKFPLRSSS